LSACNNPKVTDTAADKRPFAYAITLVVAGAIGWYAAFSLTVEKFHLLANPEAALGCDFSLLVQCRANLESWQGSLLGFPNPILGLAGWTAVIAVGVALLAGARFDRWFWIAFNVGVVGALALVIFLITTSIFVLGTLCPWCMVTWSATIPTFLMVTLNNLRNGTIPLPARLRAFAGAAYSWTPILTLALYLVVAVIAQVQLDVINHL
jgi:uncharacterized membrane protein